MSDTDKVNPLDGIEGQFIRKMSVDDLLSSDFLLNLYDISDLAERARIRALIMVVAREHGIERDIKSVLAAYDAEDERLGREYVNSLTNETNFTFTQQQLLCGAWTADDNGVKMQKKDGEKVYASRIPVVPVARLENVSTGIEKLKIQFKKGKETQSIICERSVAASASKIVGLSDKGLEVTSENAKMLVRYISDCVTYNLDTLPCYKAFSQLGWNDYGFTPYSSASVFDGEEENRHIYLAVAQSGKLADWRDYTAPLRDNILIRMAMDASFASVLIEKVGALPFVFHLWGESGTGKTVALKVAMSIWGNPALGKMTRTMNMTPNSMMSTAAFLNSLPFAGDELQTIKSKWDSYDQLIMRITEGIDRGRMSFDKNNEMRTWLCSFLFTGEDPCTQATSGGGVKNRVIEIEVTEPLFENGNDITNFTGKNFGHAGKAFIEYISELENLPQRFSQHYKHIIAETDTTEKQAASMALILLADELAGECIYPEEKVLTVGAVKEYLVSRNEVDIAERAYEYIINIIAQNSKKFEGVYYASGTLAEVWGNIRDDEILINSAILKRELTSAGFEFDTVKRKWAQYGYLILSSDGRYTRRTACYGIKARYVVLKALKSEEDELVEQDTDDYDDIPI